MEIKRQTIADVYEEACKRVFNDGDEIITEDGEITWEYPEPIILVVTDPLKQPMISSANPQGKLVVENYVHQLLGIRMQTGTNCDFTYTYGNRIFDYPGLVADTDGVYHHVGDGLTGGIDQYEWVIDILKKNPQSRRAVITIRYPWTDIITGEPPCLTIIQILIRDGRVNMTCYMRSWDILSAGNCNLYAFTHLLHSITTAFDNQQYVVGTLTVIGCSVHIYFKRDSEEVKKIRQQFFNK